VRLATMEGIASILSHREAGRFSTHSIRRILVELVTERHLINLTKREADVSVSFVPPVGPRLDVRKAGTFKLGLYASAAYLARRGTPAKVEDLPPHDFVDYVVDLVAIPKVHWLLDVLEPENVVFRSSSMAAQAERHRGRARSRAAAVLLRPRRSRGWCRCSQREVRVERRVYVTVHEDIQFMGRDARAHPLSVRAVREGRDLSQRTVIEGRADSAAGLAALACDRLRHMT
jgi:hypothetical protein